MSAQNRKCARCPHPIYTDNRTGLCRTCLAAAQARKPAASELLSADQELKRKDHELATLRKKYEASLKTIRQQERELKAVDVLGQGLETFRIEPQKGAGTSEGTVVIAASDWHVEEEVGAEVGGLNRYNLDLAKVRAEQFFRGGLRLTNLLAQDIAIPTIVLALLGDFISNDIHEELTDVNRLQPTHAIVTAQNLLVSGIEFLLNNSKYELVVPCHSGNHARTTKTTRFAAENGHSIEYLMYLHLAAYFRSEPRVKFIIPEGYHSYLEIYDQTLRFHHGHAIKYQGGIGGIFIPAYKAIAQWNKARRADLDVFGHFHQCKDGGNFICNGSMIGYNAFALSIKADYEPPKQQLLLIDKKRKRTCTWPILFSQ